MPEMILFIFAVIGATNIVVDGSIFESTRNWIKKTLPASLSSIVDCYMCAGWHCSWILSLCIFGYISLGHLFAYACAGSFLCHFTAILMNYIEAVTIINLPND